MNVSQVNLLNLIRTYLKNKIEFKSKLSFAKFRYSGV